MMYMVSGHGRHKLTHTCARPLASPFPAFHAIPGIGPTVETPEILMLYQQWKPSVDGSSLVTAGVYWCVNGKLISKLAWLFLELSSSRRTIVACLSRDKTQRDFKMPTITCITRQSEMADLARRATRWVGTLSDGNVHVKFHDDRLRND